MTVNQSYQKAKWFNLNEVRNSVHKPLPITVILFQICHFVKNSGWTVIRDPTHKNGPYAYKGNELVSFDDIDQIAEKTQYIKDMGLGGGMIWALDLDDFRNRCGCEAHPLLKTINRGLGHLSSSPPGDCNLPYTYEEEVL